MTVFAHIPFIEELFPPETVEPEVRDGLAISSPSSLLPEDEASFLYEIDPLEPAFDVVLFGVGPRWLDMPASLLDRLGRPRPIVP